MSVLVLVCPLTLPVPVANPILLPGSPSHVVVPLLGFPPPPHLKLQKLLSRALGPISMAAMTAEAFSPGAKCGSRHPHPQHWNVRLCTDFCQLILESSLYWLLCVNEPLWSYLHTLLLKSLSHHSAFPTLIRSASHPVCLGSTCTPGLISARSGTLLCLLRAPGQALTGCGGGVQFQWCTRIDCLFTVWYLEENLKVNFSHKRGWIKETFSPSDLLPSEARRLESTSDPILLPSPALFLGCR